MVVAKGTYHTLVDNITIRCYKDWLRSNSVQSIGLPVVGLRDSESSI